MSDSQTFLADTYAYRRVPRIYTAGELTLVSSPLFREHRLRLYHQQTSLANRSIMESYLIVKDRTPVMKLLVNSLSQKSVCLREPGQPPVYPVFILDMAMGQMDKVLACLEQRLREPGVPDLPDCTYIQLPDTARHAMAQLYMIQMSEADDGLDCSWMPTGYGASLGLIDGYIIQDSGQLIHTLFIPAERRMELYQTLTWPRTRWEEPQAAISLQQRLAKIRQGLPCSNASAVEPVQAFGAMPLADYMASCPEEAEKLRHQFGEMASFQEAADRIFHFCMVCRNFDDCCDFMACLVLPLISIHDGTAPVNQAVKPSLDILRLSFPSLLMGAAIASGQPCLCRNTQHILDDSLEGQADKLSTSCWTLLRTIHTRSGEEAAALLFRLFVEPFALLNRTLNARCH